jgi:2-iminobutanoate/2-iminopropanoate deaminase
MTLAWHKEVIMAPADRVPAVRTSGSAHAVRVGPLVFVTGQSGRHPGEEVDNYSEDPAEQTRQTMENIKGILEAAGTCFENVIKRTIIVSDASIYSKMRPVIESYFTSPVASTTIEGKFIWPNKVIEVEVVAVVPEEAP